MKYTAILALFIFIIFGWVWYQNQLPCQKPLAYDIGEVDSRQNFSSQDFLALIKKGEAVWEKSSGKDLFVYKKGAKIKVNLVYDDRQKTYNERKNESAALGLTQEKLEEEKSNLSLMQDSYQKNLSAYNKAVTYWNARGGAPPGVGANLKSERNTLESKARELEVAVSSYNSLAKKYNERVADWNVLAHEETTAGEARSAGEINIYLLDHSPSDSILVAHELGHALGLGHVDNEKSIMYYRLPERLISPSQADLTALNNLCSKS